MDRTENSGDGGLIAATVERWCSQSPEIDAFRGVNGQAMTFGELPAATSRIAHALAELGVRPGERIALMEGRSRYALSSLLGIWAAGLSAVLLDERHPVARLERIVLDAGCRVLVSSSPVSAGLRLKVLDPAADQLSLSAPSLKWVSRLPGDEAYVVYTSGTTGHPKGVRVSAANLENFLAAAGQLRYRPGSVAGVVVSPAFDGWLWSVLTPFVNGMTCVTLDPLAGPLGPQIAESGATNLSMTPTLYRSLERVPELEVAVVAGEHCPESLAGKLKAAAARVINVYGPTEATIASTMADTLDGGDPGCIGRPLPGCSVTIVDTDLRPVDSGVEGEIVIGGAGVSLGYADDDGHQGSAFVTYHGERFYRSGDLGVMRPDGQIEYRGRLDEQVKVGGFRFEYTEVEQLARSVPGVHDAVAFLHGTPPTVGIAIVPGSGVDDDEVSTRLRAAFREHLPIQLCPTHIRFIAEVPVNPTTGKVSRRVLRDLPGSQPAETDGSIAQADVHGHIHDAWRTAFGRSVDDDADFFALGGHSLLAAQLANEISSRVGMSVSVADVLLQPTPAGQAAIISARERS